MRLMELIQPVQEIEALARRDYTMYGAKEKFKEFSKYIPTAKEWSPGIKYFIEHNEIFTTDGKTITGTMYLVPRKNGMVISNVYVSPKFRGQGIGSALYDIALDKFGTLLSDEQQTVSGQRMWVHLHGKPGVQVYAILDIQSEFLVPKIREELRKLDAKYIGKGRFDRNEYRIPVNTQENLRRLTTNSRLLKIYGNDNYNLSLVAIKEGASRAAT